MRNYKLTINEYEDYLIELRKNVFAVLPLYESNNEYICDYVDECIDEVIYVKEIINELPHAYWYVKSLSNLLSLKDKIEEDNHKLVKRKVLNTTNLITKELNNIER